jgi:hypothetical protein
MNKLITVICIAAILSSPVAYAAVSDEEVEALREQIRILSERLDQLEQASQSTPANQLVVSDEVEALVAQKVDEKVDEKIEAKVGEQFEGEIKDQVDERMAAVAWAERIRWQGDFRYRYENIDIENVDDRNRQRIRARANLIADITDTVEVGLGLATGGSDPVSTNQTLGGGGSTKDLRLDLAYFDWNGIRDTHIMGGKIKNKLYRPGNNGLLWDGDWRPEGLGGIWDNGTFFVTGLGTWVESDSKTLNQEFSYGIQGGFSTRIGDAVKISGGLGYFSFDTAGNRSFFGDDDDFFGNSFDPHSLTYLYDYHEIEGYLEVQFNINEFPVRLFADYVQNQAVDDDNTGYAVGMKLGAASAPRSWDFSWVYQRLEADAALGLLTDSDFGGGGTNAKGSIFQGTYAIAKNWNAKATYFDNKIGLRSDNPLDFKRLQLDINFKYK